MPPSAVLHVLCLRRGPKLIGAGERSGTRGSESGLRVRRASVQVALWSRGVDTPQNVLLHFFLNADAHQK